MLIDRFSLRAFFERRLARADIVPGGGRPWDMVVHDELLWRRLLLQGSFGLGEAYVEGAWDCGALDEFFFRVVRGTLGRTPDLSPGMLLFAFAARLQNWQSRRRARRLAHYEIGNRLFESMLDTGMNYSCGYWQEADDLEAAQVAKLELVCRKLELKPGMRVLDLGCGWGGFMRHAALNHGVSCVGYTISEAQRALGTERCAGLPVEIRLEDYRNAAGRYDAIVSIGMFEHVGRRNYRAFMQTCRRCLAPEGLVLLHTIGARNSHALSAADPWLSSRIFPHGELPGMGQIAAALDGLFTMEDWHNFGADYDHTLMAWHARFEQAWPELAADYDERFHRLWRYYLLCCAGLFRARGAHLWQLVLSRKGRLEGYRAPR